jgi:hypothetical protein
LEDLGVDGRIILKINLKIHRNGRIELVSFGLGQ